MSPLKNILIYLYSKEREREKQVIVTPSPKNISVKYKHVFDKCIYLEVKLMINKKMLIQL